jgi:hypothetical protein
MREPSPTANVFGIVAEFDSADRLLDGVTRARDEGFRRMDAYSPFPVQGLAQRLGMHDRRVVWLTFLGGFSGAALAYVMQVYTNLNYPIEIGGRPLLPIPAFLLITFELTVLFAVLFSIGGMLVLNHLPRLHHPIFDVEAFHLASSDKFFLVVFGDDEKFDRENTWRFLEELAPVRVDVVEHTEEPE